MGLVCHNHWLIVMSKTFLKQRTNDCDTLNPFCSRISLHLPSQRRYYRLQQLELRFILQMEMCSSHHIRAQYIEISNLLRCKVERVQEAVSGFTNPFCSNFEDNELYFLSFGVPPKPGITKDLIEADDIGRKALADFIDSLLFENLSFTIP